MIDAREKAKELIKRFEGYSAEPYYCSAHKKTIGWGHVILPNEGFTHIQPEYAELLLNKDIDIADNAIDRYVTRPLHPEHRAALISFVFNVGVDAFKKSTLLKKLNKGDYHGAGKEFDRWVKATVGGKKVTLNGLIKRRDAEELVFYSLPWRKENA